VAARIRFFFRLPKRSFMHFRTRLEPPPGAQQRVSEQSGSSYFRLSFEPGRCTSSLLVLNRPIYVLVPSGRGAAGVVGEPERRDRGVRRLSLSARFKPSSWSIRKRLSTCQLLLAVCR
jgi:hypothetical protein